MAHPIDVIIDIHMCSLRIAFLRYRLVHLFFVVPRVQHLRGIGPIVPKMKLAMRLALVVSRMVLFHVIGELCVVLGEGCLKTRVLLYR